MINPMMYRVFLQDEKDAPGPSKNPSDRFRIRSGELLAWCYSSPGWKPNLEEQLRVMNFGSNESSYRFARKRAVKLAEHLSREKGKLYVFIDVTSRSDKELAEKLLQTINSEEVYVPSPNAADIGD